MTHYPRLCVKTAGNCNNSYSIPVTTIQSKGAHLQFCKRYLQVHNKALSMARRAELDKYPMIIDINKEDPQLLRLSTR